MNALIDFMNRMAGRLARVVLGVALIAWGLLSLGGAAGYAVAIVGLVPIGMALWGHCLLEIVTRRPAKQQA